MIDAERLDDLERRVSAIEQEMDRQALVQAIKRRRTHSTRCVCQSTAGSAAS